MEIRSYIEELKIDIEMLDVELNGCCYWDERKEKLMLKKSMIKEITDLMAKLKD
jgi:hypothetical protein